MKDITDEEDTVRYLTVIEGELLFRAGNEVYTVSAGDEIRIAGGRDYSMENRSGTFARVSMIISYERSSRRF